MVSVKIQLSWELGCAEFSRESFTFTFNVKQSNKLKVRYLTSTDGVTLQKIYTSTLTH